MTLLSVLGLTRSPSDALSLRCSVSRSPSTSGANSVCVLPWPSGWPALGLVVKLTPPCATTCALVMMNWPSKRAPSPCGSDRGSLQRGPSYASTHTHLPCVVRRRRRRRSIFPHQSGIFAVQMGSILNHATARMNHTLAHQAAFHQRSPKSNPR